MIVYHGTTMKIEKPKIFVNEIGRDFGFAFYTTDIKEQAERWAVRKENLERRRLKSQIHPIANDNVGETVAYVMQGIMRKEDAIKRLKFEKINNQIAFCSTESLRTIKFIESYEIGGR